MSTVLKSTVTFNFIFPNSRFLYFSNFLSFVLFLRDKMATDYMRAMLDELMGSGGGNDGDGGEGKI